MGADSRQTRRPKDVFVDKAKNMRFTTQTKNMGADSGQLFVQIHGSDLWIRSMDLIHRSDGVKNRTSATKWVGNRNCELSIGGTEAEN